MLGTYVNSVLTTKMAQLSPCFYQTLRWKRKPRKPFWLGTARSKMFKFVEAPVLPDDEKRELHRLYSHYNCAMKSIKNYYVEKSAEEVKQVTELATNEAIEESLKMNEAWNAECARIRAERLTQLDKIHEEIAIQIMDEKEKHKASLLEKVEALVRLEKERSQDFVTRENLDAKIEELLDSHTDYNYAIDLEGNKYTGFQGDMKQVTDQIEASIPYVNISKWNR